MSQSAANDAALTRYYRWQSRFYDATRWSFLFGRSALVRELAKRPSRRVLEIGCGTGRNLALLAAAFPQARVTGIDLSPDMVDIARRKLGAFGERVDVRCGRYQGGAAEDARYDLIVISYMLSMANPGWDGVIAAAKSDLAPGGRIGVVDFERTPSRLFRTWMRRNHVRMESHLLPALRAAWPSFAVREQCAYFGLWRYFRFVGTAE